MFLIQISIMLLSVW